MQEKIAMLLNDLLARQQSQFDAIQGQIEQLQEQQRQIQAFMQRIGSCESKMESAAALMQQAIATVREVCPEELDAYRAVVLSLFEGHTIAHLPEADADETAADDPDEPDLPGGETDGAADGETDEGVDVNADEVEVQAVEADDPADPDDDPDSDDPDAPPKPTRRFQSVGSAAIELDDLTLDQLRHIAKGMTPRPKGWYKMKKAELRRIIEAHRNR
ncbi:hypothetical protein [Lyngbya sp. CCY1209]|uniref:hypothetical protein n=1 Tax=Lyngbya sp. CCY1209 TaxID=2886103 RepID=UPI002D20292B|nr:hypothetical protein [Lyngbya sp. CCY1209]MEB3884027.1 hypothetical protein [Lyngbya sp. CCY1209]